MDKHELYNECLRKWGLESQILMLVEESAELTQATLGLLRARESAMEHFAEEIADVELMIDEMKHYFYYPDDNLQKQIDVWHEKKVERLQKLLSLLVKEDN